MPWFRRTLSIPVPRRSYVFLLPFFDSKALTDPAKYFNPKQPIHSPGHTVACKKTRPWLYKVSTSWVDLVSNGNAKFNLSICLSLNAKLNFDGKVWD